MYILSILYILYILGITSCSIRRYNQMLILVAIFPSRSVALKGFLPNFFKAALYHTPRFISSVGPTGSPRFRNLQFLPQIPKTIEGPPILSFKDTVLKLPFFTCTFKLYFESVFQSYLLKLPISMFKLPLSKYLLNLPVQVAF